MPMTPLSLGTFGENVASVQSLLGQQGFPTSASEVDRKFFGPATQQAVRLFQQKTGLPVTGAVDEPRRQLHSPPGCLSFPRRIFPERQRAKRASPGLTASLRGPFRPAGTTCAQRSHTVYTKSEFDAAHSESHIRTRQYSLGG